MEYNHNCYVPVFEDISEEDDDEEEDVPLDLLSSFPNGECSRTSPGNHSTVRRWRQRIAWNDEIVAEDNLLRTHSATGLSPISVKTPSVTDLSGPSSAPSIIQWGTGTRQFSPVASSTAVATVWKKMSFDISSIVEEDRYPKYESSKAIFTEAAKTKTSSGQSIPVGIAVGRQRIGQQMTHDGNRANTQAGRDISASQTQAISASSLHPPLHNPGFIPLPSLTPVPSPVPLPYQSPYPHYPMAPSAPSQWTQSLDHQTHYNYPTAYPPDHSYYMLLQQQLLMLHHHHTQFSNQIPAPIPTLGDFQRQSYSDSAIAGENQNTEERIENNTTIEKSKIQAQAQQQHIATEIFPQKTKSESSVKETLKGSRKDDSALDMSNESNKDNCENDSFLDVDSISVGDQKEILSFPSNEDILDETLIDEDCGDNSIHIDVMELDNTDKNSLNNGLYLLAESIECVERNNEETKRKVRYASTDCCDYEADSLQILCDVANLQPKTSIAAKDLSQRVARSKSLDTYKHNIDRTQKSTAAQNNIKEFIAKKVSKEKKQDKVEMMPTQQNIDDMDAWELELRIKMAEKQRKYNEINKKLMRIQKFKTKSAKNLNKILKLKKSILRKQKQKKKDDADMYRWNIKRNKRYDFQNEKIEEENISKFKNSYLLSKRFMGSEKQDHSTINTNIDLSPTLEGRKETTKAELKENSGLLRQVAEEKHKSYLNNNSNKEESDFINEKSLVAEYYQDTNVVTRESKCENLENDFSQYKHKKIRRISKDCETFKVDDQGHRESIKDFVSSINLDRNINMDVNYISKQTKKLNYMPSKKIHQKSNADSDHEYELKMKKKKKKDKKKKKEKRKKQEEIRLLETSLKSVFANSSSHEVEHVRCCKLKPDDLVEGLRILKKIDSHFYPGRLTDISAPDIYGIVVDKERGNKPHIFSQEEVLNEAVLEIKPLAVNELNIGARVCAFWSNQMNYLYPGTVVGPDIDENFVIIQLDDGDSRDIHIDQVRYLPEGYPFVVPDGDNTFGSRKRVSTSQSQVTDDKKRKIYHDDNRSKKHTKYKSKKKKHKECKWSVSVTEVSDHDNCESKSYKLPLSESSDESTQRDDGQDSSSISTVYREDTYFDDQESITLHDRRPSVSDKSAIAAFLPPQLLLWSWADEGHKLSAKARKIYHNSIEKDDETISVGDCAVFLSTGRPDRPYIGRIDSMWQTSVGGMKVQVKWFYHQAEVEGTAVGGGRVQDIKTEGALFSSSHYDENDVQTISHKCQVLQFADYKRLVSSSGGLDLDSNDTYYLAGEYDPVVGTIVFQKGVFE